MNYHKLIKTKQLRRSHLHIIRGALFEDIGKQDITTELIIPKDKNIKAVLLAKEECIICGLEIAGHVFRVIDKDIKFSPLVKEGQKIKRGAVVAKLKGKAGSILSAERVCLNLLGLLSGVATKTRSYVDKIKPYKVKIIDTRKTLPGLRELQKYAVRVGGGFNHRMALDEMILVKDNHLKVMGEEFWNIGFRQIKKTSHFEIEIEVKTLKEFKRALKLKPDIIMLDNMSLKDMKKATQLRNNLSANNKDPIPKLEASGGITLKNVRQIAKTGVDMISIGALTHSVKSPDLSLEVF